MLRQEDNDQDEDENEEITPYWDDAIDKYFNRPDHEAFNNITYTDYFKNYTIRSKLPGPRSKMFSTRDQKNRIVVQRKTPVLL